MSKGREILKSLGIDIEENDIWVRVEKIEALFDSAVKVYGTEGTNQSNECKHSWSGGYPSTDPLDVNEAWVIGKRRLVKATREERALELLGQLLQGDAPFGWKIEAREILGEGDGV